MSKKTLIVIGNGMVGHHFLEQLVETPAAADFDIKVFGEEKLLAYDRVHLSEYFGGSTHADLAMGTADWYAENHIDLRLGEQVTGIDRANQTITTPMGDYAYDEPVASTSSSYR